MMHEFGSYRQIIITMIDEWSIGLFIDISCLFVCFVVQLCNSNNHIIMFEKEDLRTRFLKQI